MAEEETEKPSEEGGAEGEEGKEDKEQAETGEGESGQEGGAKKKKGKNKLILVGVLGVVLLIVAGLAIVMALGSKKEEASEVIDEAAIESEEGESAGHADVEKAPVDDDSMPIFLDMPEFLVNLNSTGKRTSFLKMIVTIDMPNEDTKKVVELNMPRIRDNFHIYLHELRAEDLQGAVGLQLLREELLLRINQIIHPKQINDVLFKEVLVQ